MSLPIFCEVKGFTGVVAISVLLNKFTNLLTHYESLLHCIGSSFLTENVFLTQKIAFVALLLYDLSY